ncbi:MAG: hypothetical protein JKY18_10240 [Flavobacteriales bacterium]|nr:hypothetical protein [Flavobacteriales bacterium]
MAPTSKMFQAFKMFQDKDAFFDDLSRKDSNNLIINQVLIICGFAFLYGLVMGSYHGVQQSLTAGIKVVLLFLSTIIICFPSFYIIQMTLGSRLNFRQMITIILAGFVLTTIITLSFAPVVLFFHLTGNNYYFLQLLHVTIFLFAGFFGMNLIVDALKHACEKKDVYPKIGITVFRVWVVILAFVGVQLAWNLRPFLSDKGEDFKLFRNYEGNFYTAVIYSIERLVDNKASDSQETEPAEQPAQDDQAEEVPALLQIDTTDTPNSSDDRDF